MIFTRLKVRELGSFRGDLPMRMYKSYDTSTCRLKRVLVSEINSRFLTVLFLN